MRADLEPVVDILDPSFQIGDPSTPTPPRKVGYQSIRQLPIHRLDHGVRDSGIDGLVVILYPGEIGWWR